MILKYGFLLKVSENQITQIVTHLTLSFSLTKFLHWNTYFRKYDPQYRFKIWLPEDEAIEMIGEEEFKMLKALEGP